MAAKDQTVPVSAASALADRLKAASINVTFQIVTAGHEITDEMASVGKSWLDKVVRSGK
jgi:predicted esterase